MLDKYIDQVTDLIPDIDLRFKIRKIVLEAYYGGREEGCLQVSEAIKVILQDKKL